MKHFKNLYIAVAVMAVLSVGLVATFTMAGNDPEIIIIMPKDTISVNEGTTKIQAIYIGGKAPANGLMPSVTEGFGSIGATSQKGNALSATWNIGDGTGPAVITVITRDGTVVGTANVNVTN